LVLLSRLQKVAECTEAEIATITGHSLRDVRGIIDGNYLHRVAVACMVSIRCAVANA
jgi:hypothetical protein